MNVNLAGLSEPTTGYRSSTPDPWWKRLGNEVPVGSGGCPEGCSPTSIDLYCAEHETFLPREGREELSKTHWALIVGAAAAVYALFWIAAALHTWLPLYVLFVVSVGCILRLTLRRLPLARALATGLWIVAAGATPWAATSQAHTRESVLAASISALLLWLGHVTVTSRQEDDDIEDGTAITVGTFLGGLSAGSFVTLLAVPAVLGSGSWEQSSLRPILLWTGAGSGAGVLVIALLTALGQGAVLMSTRVDGMRMPAKPAPVQFGRPTLGPRPRQRGLANQMSRAMTVFAFIMRRAAVSLAESAANFLRHVGHLLLRALVVLVNALWTGLVLSLRYLGATFAYWLDLLLLIGLRLIGAGLRSLRTTALPVVSGAVAVASLYVASLADRDYLDHGGLAAAARLSIAFGVMVVTTCVLWSAWSGLRISEAFRSSTRNVRGLVVSALACQAIGGWLIGLPGTLGHGPIRVGWFTGAATLGFAVAIAWSHFFSSGEAPVASGVATPRP